MAKKKPGIDKRRRWLNNKHMALTVKDIDPIEFGDLMDKLMKEIEKIKEELRRIVPKEKQVFAT